jgi:hypothetical protein
MTWAILTITKAGVVSLLQTVDKEQTRRVARRLIRRPIEITEDPNAPILAFSEPTFARVEIIGPEELDAWEGVEPLRVKLEKSAGPRV